MRRTSFERLSLPGEAQTGAGNDRDNTIGGAGGGNALTGRDVLNDLSGDERLFGGEGHDRLIGGGGADTLTGNAEQGTMTGGAGNDRFDALVATDGRPIRAETITDFTRGADVVDLTAIDANKATAANDTYVRRGTAAFTAAGRFRIVDLGADLRIELNTIGTEGAAAIILRQRVGTVTKGDFLL